MYLKSVGQHYEENTHCAPFFQLHVKPAQRLKLYEGKKQQTLAVCYLALTVTVINSLSDSQVPCYYL